MGIVRRPRAHDRGGSRGQGPGQVSHDLTVPQAAETTGKAMRSRSSFVCPRPDRAWRRLDDVADLQSASANGAYASVPERADGSDALPKLVPAESPSQPLEDAGRLAGVSQPAWRASDERRSS